jgi:DNA-binding response OmpR family regulator
MSDKGPLAGKRILILEDDFYLATDEKALLEQAGASVVGPFGSASREHHILGAGPLDAAVVDINLGNGPRFDFAHLLRDQGVPFVFVTGYDAATVPPELSNTRRIEKPIRERELIAALAELVGQPAPG